MSADHAADHALPVLELCLGGGWHAGVGVAPDGTLWPWLVAPAADDPGPGYRVTPPHEQVGPLPVDVRRRVQAVPIRCAAPTLHGRPCGTPVSTPGLRCHHHRTKRRHRDHAEPRAAPRA